MKQRGFTVIELIVVISIIALLLATIVPSLSMAGQCARATLCRGNLQRICGVFSLAGQRSIGQATVGDLAMIFPPWRSWPRQAQGVCGDKPLYRCPEDRRQPIDMEALRRGVEYRSTYGGGIAIPLVGDVENNYVLSRRGPSFTEYVFEEAGNINQSFWIPGHHNDGWLRLHDDGIIEIVSCNCGGDNQLWIDGKPAFGSDPKDKRCTQMKMNVGRKLRTRLSEAGLSSYGVNSYAHRYPYASKTLVLLDYEARTANPDDPAKTRQLLLASRRHLRRINVLIADGAVRPMGVSQLDPITDRTFWDPDLLPPDGDEAEQ